MRSERLGQYKTGRFDGDVKRATEFRCGGRLVGHELTAHAKNNPRVFERAGQDLQVMSHLMQLLVVVDSHAGVVCVAAHEVNSMCRQGVVPGQLGYSLDGGRIVRVAKLPS